MTEKRISLWSGPRNVSTTLLYSFAQRLDTTVLDEPLYGHYLRVTGAQHPGREEVLEAMSQDGSAIVQDICDNDFGSSVLFVKNMAHHLVDLDLSFLDELHNVLLIRDPKEVIPSMIKQLPKPTLADTGLRQQWELYSHLRELGHNPLIIDSRELLLKPDVMLVKVCHILDIPFFQEMLTWEKGPIKEDGVWAKHWYHNVHQSTGFNAYKPKKEPVPPHLTTLWEQCDHYYQKLFEHALKANH
jgi:hypothetical protein